ncbi:hypothetical protein OO17_25245 [Rhodopseudomonas palustris]|uniref:CHAD domain-containing protein n=1 Tax=Rhodopseudomonas palustris TaxID=1076 RepID=A0A0D7E4V2_RHOPL|nr:hypothetical protein OO17_25245 [Rhodopseudomonas palustris]
MRRPSRPVNAKPPGALVLDPDAGTVEALQAICRWTLQTIAAQQQAVRQRKPVGVHQMRIGLRRMRAAISLFGDLLDDDQTDHIKAELKWLAGRLAPARDLHVMQMKVAQLDGARALQKQLAASRIAAFDQARAAVEQPRFRALLREIARWIDHGAWAAPPPGKRRNAKRFAKRVLAKRAAQVIDKAARLDQMSVEKRHRLRIAAKKLYYATGFFETLFGDPKPARQLTAFKKKLKALLDALGALNDIAVQGGLASKLADAPNAPTPPATRAIESLSEQNRADSKALLKSAAKAGRKLARTPLFAD